MNFVLQTDLASDTARIPIVDVTVHINYHVVIGLCSDPRHPKTSYAHSSSSWPLCLASNRKVHEGRSPVNMKTPEQRPRSFSLSLSEMDVRKPCFHVYSFDAVSLFHTRTDSRRTFYQRVYEILMLYLWH